MKEKIVPLFKQSVTYSLGGFAGSLVGIFLVPLYTRVFTPDDYGVINLVQITIAFLAVFLILGTDNATGRYYLDTESDQDRKLTASTAMIFRAIMLVAGCLVFICFSDEISQLIFNTTIYSNYLIIAAAALPFVHCATLSQHMLRYNFRSTSYVILSVARLLVTVTLIILLVVFWKWGITGIFAATLISSILFLLIQFFITRGYFSHSFSRRRLRELLRYGVPLVPYGITVYLIQNCDRYFLSYFSTLTQVGLYSLGSQLASALTLLFAGTGLAWSPFIFSTYKQGGSKAVYSKVIDYLVSATFFCVIGLSLFSREILLVFTTPQYFGAYIVVPFLALYLAFYHLGLRMSFGISIARKTLHFAWISAVTAAVNVGLNFLLVPPYGMIGAAIATLICSIVWCILLVSVSQRYYRINYNLGSFLKVLGVTAAIISAGYFFFSDISVANILIKVALLGIYTVCIYLFRLVGKEELSYLKSVNYKRLLNPKNLISFFR